MGQSENQHGRMQLAVNGFGAEAQHGGSTRAGHRKVSRPIEPSLPLYLALRSSRARGKWSLQRSSNEARIQDILRELCQRHGVRVLASFIGKDQIHLLVRARTREGFQAFLRAFAGLTARLVTGAKKGKPSGRFWDALTFSRVLAWGEEFEAVRASFENGDLAALAPTSSTRRRLPSKPN